jgi:hypothetical protein
MIAALPYVYSGGYHQGTTEGTSATLPVSHPRVSAGGHSLVEIAVQGDNQNNDVEAGWIIDGPGKTPVMFTYAFKNGAGLGYRYFGGVSSATKFGIRYTSGKWTVYRNNSAVTTYPESTWSGSFTKGDTTQAFGETYGDAGMPTGTITGYSASTFFGTTKHTGTTITIGEN